MALKKGVSGNVVSFIIVLLVLALIFAVIMWLPQLKDAFFEAIDKVFKFE